MNLNLINTKYHVLAKSLQSSVFFMFNQLRQNCYWQRDLSESALTLLFWWFLEIIPVDFDGLILPIDLYEPSFDFVKDVSGRPHKGSFHIFLIFGWGLHIEHLIIPGQFQGFIPGDHPLLGEIGLVADEDQHYILVAVGLDILDPSTDTAKGLFAGEVEDYEGCGWWAVVGTGDGAEFLLAGSVPDLQFYCLVANWDVLGTVLDTDCVLMIRIELTIDKATDETGFSDSCVSD